MLLGGVFLATGNASPAALQSKRKYVELDLLRCAREAAVPFKLNPHFPVNTLGLMRALTGIYLHTPTRFEMLLGALFEAMWVEALDLGDTLVFNRRLRMAGFDAEAVLSMAEDAATKQALRQSTDEAIQRGAFGAPTFFVDGQMFFGQDRLHFVRAALERKLHEANAIISASTGEEYDRD
jgi:2-hydroxychromene-2-carboxylate isomerase